MRNGTFIVPRRGCLPLYEGLFLEQFAQLYILSLPVSFEIIAEMNVLSWLPDYPDHGIYWKPQFTAILVVNLGNSLLFLCSSQNSRRNISGVTTYTARLCSIVIIPP